MAVSSQRDASKAGAEILAAGGNAIDAAVAVGYALAVVHPCCGNIGGGGFATIHLANGKDTFINFREKAPAAASANMYLDADGNVIPEPFAPWLQGGGRARHRDGHGEDAQRIWHHEPRPGDGAGHQTGR